MSKKATYINMEMLEPYVINDDYTGKVGLF